MARINQTSIFDLSKAIATKAGGELRDFVTYVAEALGDVLRNLRNGLTFTDNFDCELKTVSLRTSTETIVSIKSKKRPRYVLVGKISSDTYYRMDSWGWKFNSAGELVVKATFADSPAATLDIDVDLIIVFG